MVNPITLRVDLVLSLAIPHCISVPLWFVACWLCIYSGHILGSTPPQHPQPVPPATGNDTRPPAFPTGRSIAQPRPHHHPPTPSRTQPPAPCQPAPTNRFQQEDGTMVRRANLAPLPCRHLIGRPIFTTHALRATCAALPHCPAAHLTCLPPLPTMKTPRAKMTACCTSTVGLRAPACLCLPYAQHFPCHCAQPCLFCLPLPAFAPARHHLYLPHHIPAAHCLPSAYTSVVRPAAPVPVIISWCLWWTGPLLH